MGKRGRKICPKCNTELGARTITCSCGYDFYPTKVVEKKKDPVKEEVPVEEVKKEIETIFYEEIPKLTPKEHAKRILSYGKERAKILLFLAQTRKYWSHVDWEIVEKGL